MITYYIRQPVRACTTLRCNQRGVTLVVSLIFLLLLTILGITAMNTSTLQEKMSGNLRDQDMALQAAESALRGGETALRTAWAGGKPFADPACASTVCSLGTVQVTNDTWWFANSMEYGGTGTQITGAAAEPRFALEELSDEPLSLNLCTPKSCPRAAYYRITSRAVGTTPIAQSILEETFRVRH